MSRASAKPYLIRAIYGWCTDSDFTPYIAVFINNSTNVPREFIKNDEIVLNVSFNAISQLSMSSGWITFYARFSGVSHEIEVLIENILAVCAHESGQGTIFPVECNTPTTWAATEYENNPPPELVAVDSESTSASIPVRMETGPEGELTPSNVPHIDEKPVLKVVE